jgi:nicotinamide-nucleotide amidase
MAFSGGFMISLEETVVRKLKTTQHILSTVESCTGGLISHLITNVSGASEVYWGTSVAYDNSFKEDLGVPKELIAAHGAVSMEVARALAEHGLQKMQRIIPNANSYALLKPRGLACLSTTGIAGPSGGTREKPVGTCFIGLAVTGKKTIIEMFHANPATDRLQTKLQFAQKALELIRGSF